MKGLDGAGDWKLSFIVETWRSILGAAGRR
jgi:hypothetical protein